MQSAYVNVKVSVPEGEMYGTGNMYIFEGQAGGALLLQHSTVNNDPDQALVISPPSTLAYEDDILTVKNGGTFELDWDAKTVTWEDGHAWFGTAPIEWAALIIRNDDGSVTNLAYP